MMKVLKFKEKKILRAEAKLNDIIKCEAGAKKYIGIIFEKNNKDYPTSFKIYFIKHSKKIYNQKFYIGFLIEPTSTYTIYRKEKIQCKKKSCLNK